MKYGVADALVELKPGAKWSCLCNVYSGITWHDSSQTIPTEEQVTAKIAALDALEPMRLLRIERDAKLAACDWRASSDLTLADSWKTYRQALRDLPASASPKLDSNYNLDFSSFTWPTEPS